MSVMTESEPEQDALAKFTQGFSDGWNNRPRKKNLGGQYLRAYARGVDAALREQGGGEDLGKFGKMTLSRKRA